MDSKGCSQQESFVALLDEDNLEVIRRHVDSLSTEERNDLLHHVVCQRRCDEDDVGYPNKLQRVLLMLGNVGCDVNVVDKDGTTPLHHGIESNRADLCKVLLQLGSLVDIPDNNGRTVLDIWHNEQDPLHDDVKDVLQVYMPGLVKAVDDDVLGAVRRLVNLWCRVDITSQDGSSLLQLSLERGTENIIRIIKEIAPTMKLVHSVLALDMASVDSLCKGSTNLNLEFKNLGDSGATPLFYSIQANHLDLVSLLLDHGAKISTTMSLTGQEVDMPIYFTALNSYTSTDIIKRLTPIVGSSPSVDQLYCQGEHVLFYCIDNNVPPVAVEYIIQQSGGSIIALRNASNQTPHQYADYLGKTEYSEVISKVVSTWVANPESERVQTLSLLGYDDVDEDDLQTQVKSFMEAIQDGDVETTRQLMNYTTAEGKMVCLVKACVKGDGQPALHTAVLYGHTEIVLLLVEAWVLEERQQLDIILDQFHRTALHYAQGTGDTASASILLDYGASDFALDRDNKSPLLFKETCDHPLMGELIQQRRMMDYSNPEANPWSDPSTRKIRVICSHHKQELINQEKVEQSSDDGLTCRLL